MGLDTSHNAWHGPYSSFNRFRTMIAEKIGIKLEDMEGFGGNKSFSEVNHPIVPLLDHSDCDGELSVEECKSIVEGIDLILSDFNVKTDEDVYFVRYMKQFSDGCKLAISRNENIQFC